MKKSCYWAIERDDMMEIRFNEIDLCLFIDSVL